METLPIEPQDDLSNSEQFQPMASGTIATTLFFGFYFSNSDCDLAKLLNETRPQLRQESIREL
jgi:hypothetical protein